MIKRIITILVITHFIFSCNSDKSKKNILKEDKIPNAATAENNADVIYLDKSEDIQSVLCQDWVLADDAEGLRGQEENSNFEIPYRSLYLSTMGTFVKNPRNTFDYGNWTFDNATKTITLNNTVDKNKDVYKIARMTYDEIELRNMNASSVTNLKFVAPRKRLKNANDEPYLLNNNRWRIKPKSQRI